MCITFAILLFLFSLFCCFYVSDIYDCDMNIEFGGLLMYKSQTTH